MKVVVVVPTYNERESIQDLLNGLKKAASRITGHTLSYLIVDDTSPDGTGSVVASYQKSHTDVYLLSGKKQGLGRALLRGMLYAIDHLGADIVVQMDADLSHDPAVLPEFIRRIDRGANFAVGSRYIPGGSIPGNWAPHRKLFSVIGNAVVRFGLGFSHIHDWTGGYRAYHKQFVLGSKDELGKYSGYVFQIAFLHKSIKLGAHIVEVPIHFTDRRFGHSKIAPSQYVRDVLLYVFRSRWEQTVGGPSGKFLVVGTIGLMINTAVLELLVALGLHPAGGSAIGAECAIVSNFFLNNRWTFVHRRITGGRTVRKFFQFNVASLGAMVIQAGTVWLGTMAAGIQAYRLFYLLGVGFGLIWNYTMYSRVIWKK